VNIHRYAHSIGLTLAQTVCVVLHTNVTADGLSSRGRQTEGVNSFLSHQHTVQH